MKYGRRHMFFTNFNLTEETQWENALIAAFHRMVGVGRDLCGSSSSTLLPKQGHLQ